MPALARRDWLAVAYWLVGILRFTAVSRLGQRKEARTTRQKVVFIMLVAVSASFVLVPGSHPIRTGLVGLAIAPIPFLADVVVATLASRKSRTGRDV